MGASSWESQPWEQPLGLISVSASVNEGIAISDSFASIAWCARRHALLYQTRSAVLFHTDLKFIQFLIVLVCLYLCGNNTTKPLGQFYSKER